MEEKLTCPVCGFQAGAILAHIRKTHNMTSEDFKKQYPGVSLRKAWAKGASKATDPRIAKLGEASRDSKIGKTSNAALSEDQWSRDYKKCVICNTTKYPHASNGVCSNCRINQYKLDTRQGKIKVSEKSIWQEDDDKMLRDFYPTTRMRDLEEMLDKEEGQIKSRVQVLGLNRDIDKVSRQDIYRQHLPSELNEEETQVIYGSLLGDGCICIQKNDNYCFREEHCIEQLAYLKWKNQKLARWGSRVYEYPLKFVCHMDTHYHSLWKDIYDSIYSQSTTRVITDDWLNKIDFLGLSILIADDGTLHTKGGATMRIEINNFSHEEVAHVADVFSDKFGVKFTKTEHGLGYPRLMIPAQDYRKLVPNLIIPPGMEYKFKV